MFKKKDNGRDKFQILIATVRGKLVNVKQMHEYAARALIRAIESGKKVDIRSKVMSEYKLKQQLDAMNLIAENGRELLKCYADLWTDHPSESLQNQYIEIFSYREMVNMPQVVEHWNNFPIKGASQELKEYEELLDDDEIAEYLNDFASVNKINDKGKEYLRILYPCGNVLDMIPTGTPMYPPPPN
ncbi:hypothetical protein TVAG_203820 [Trichomonas vaginalis G3]|uniref:Uncharacterized protein n=1 Tax=Trichomonas vaginalis (strain ATCC PRA-98 / G3) TaxID=412133 RepID=A2ETF8_TRIV3|nr:hypothetical protein TVAGG3_0763860 [Trichomonas vaginalis G3]EAY04078.1 hypothetical protein TVAG_203820 [Trichomonas vaginalis G3]KAI5513396.1 hypothetical protein TVAGG3_0763860 [Trichomonas vaginalis G3]|eukprot:XP_001316301.1 hypothetical protein [Trichomonas vaginalis G3]